MAIVTATPCPLCGGTKTINPTNVVQKLPDGTQVTVQYSDTCWLCEGAGTIQKVT